MGKTAREIAAAEARVLVGKILFGDDWIGKLSTAEMRLLSGENGFQRKVLPNGRPINIIGKCPSHLRKKLDLAIGRSERAYVQLSTAIDVMHDAGFSDVGKTYDTDALDQFLTKLRNAGSTDSVRRVGKPPDLIEAVKRSMESDVQAGLDLAAMKEKQLAAKYSVSRGTARKARQEVIEKHSRK